MELFPFTNPEVEERVNRLQLPFNEVGLDPLGVSRKHLALFYTILAWFYRSYFSVRTVGIEHVPQTGRAMVIGNHSGGLPVDASMVMASLFLEPDTPRLAHGMVEKFAQQWPIVSQWFSRLGQLTGLPEHAVRILEGERLLMVFPEGARGTGKLYADRYKLVRFGTGFMRLALQTNTPIIPFAFIGGEEALKVIYHADLLARITKAPYWPVPKHLIPVPLPVECAVHFGEPMRFEGDGTESDDVVAGYVTSVKTRVEELIVEGLVERGGDIPEWIASKTHAGGAA